jgi:hypothetical protein
VHVKVNCEIRRTHLLKSRVVSIEDFTLRIAVSILCNDIGLVFLCHVLHRKIGMKRTGYPGGCSDLSVSDTHTSLPSVQGYLSQWRWYSISQDPDYD